MAHRPLAWTLATVTGYCLPREPVGRAVTAQGGRICSLERKSSHRARELAVGFAISVCPLIATAVEAHQKPPNLVMLMTDLVDSGTYDFA
jgi:hypothetical protein